MQLDAAGVAKQINILTGAFGIGVILIGAFLAYLKVSTANAITLAVTASQERVEIKIAEATKELKQELARKDLMDAKFMELDRRVTKTETWREATTLTSSKNSS